MHGVPLLVQVFDQRLALQQIAEARQVDDQRGARWAGRLPVRLLAEGMHDIEGLGVAAVHQGLENAHGLIIVRLFQRRLRLAQGRGVVGKGRAARKRNGTEDSGREQP